MRSGLKYARKNYLNQIRTDQPSPYDRKSVLAKFKDAITNTVKIPQEYFPIIERWLQDDRKGIKDVVETKFAQMISKENPRRLAAAPKTRNSTIGKLLTKLTITVTISFLLLSLLAGAVFLRHRLRCKRRRTPVTELQRVVIHE